MVSRHGPASRGSQAGPHLCPRNNIYPAGLQWGLPGSDDTHLFVWLYSETASLVHAVHAGYYQMREGSPAAEGMVWSTEDAVVNV